MLPISTVSYSYMVHDIPSYRCICVYLCVCICSRNLRKNFYLEVLAEKNEDKTSGRNSHITVKSALTYSVTVANS